MAITGKKAFRAIDAYIGIGSNLGDRRSYMRNSIRSLKNTPGITVKKVSSIIETEPEGGPPQGNYLNCVVKVSTSLSAQALLKILLGIESAHGRIRTCKNGPRTIDMDILLYGEDKIKEKNLTVPHPRMKKRLFVMKPLRQIAPRAYKKITADADKGCHGSVP